MLHQTRLAACQQCQEERKPQYQATTASTEDLIESTSMWKPYHTRMRKKQQQISDLYQFTEGKSKYRRAELVATAETGETLRYSRQIFYGMVFDTSFMKPPH